MGDFLRISIRVTDGLIPDSSAQNFMATTLGRNAPRLHWPAGELLVFCCQIGADVETLN